MKSGKDYDRHNALSNGFSKKDYLAFAPEMTETTAKKDLARMVEQKHCRKECAGPATVYVVLDKK